MSRHGEESRDPRQNEMLTTVRQPRQSVEPIESGALLVRIKRVSMTDESRLHISLEAEHISPAGLEQVKRVLSLQVGPAIVSFRPLQTDLFDG